MNKYQREKKKRMKSMQNLGIGYYTQKSILRKFDLEHVDKIIEQLNIVKNNPGIMQKIENVFKRFIDMLKCRR